MTNPTIEELQELDMTTLLSMLAYQTELHYSLLKTEPTSSSIVLSSTDFIHSIQAVIEIKKNLEKNATSTSASTDFIRDATRLDPPN